MLRKKKKSDDFGLRSLPRRSENVSAEKCHATSIVSRACLYEVVGLVLTSAVAHGNVARMARTNVFEVMCGLRYSLSSSCWELRNSLESAAPLF